MYFIINMDDESALKMLSEYEKKYNIAKGEDEEKLMVVKFLTGNEKVLEIGANIGRVTSVIAKILSDNNNNNFVTIESDSSHKASLESVKAKFSIDFKIEMKALSKQRLIQKGWITKISSGLRSGYKIVSIMTYSELIKKYNIEFDTLVIDCEGAFYHILKDFPNMLENIKMIIIENDYRQLEHIQYVDKCLSDNNFKCVYSKGGPRYVKRMSPHSWKRFYEVWKK